MSHALSTSSALFGSSRTDLLKSSLACVSFVGVCHLDRSLNAAAKENLPLLFLVIDNGRAINTFTPDVATNNDVFLQAPSHRSAPLLHPVDGCRIESRRSVVDSGIPCGRQSPWDHACASVRVRVRAACEYVCASVRTCPRVRACARVQGQHYGVPGIKVDGGNLKDTLRTGRAVVDY
eukprot:3804836-Pleurochrysis_carterae.AAC.1